MVDDGERGELTRDGGGPMLPPFFRDSEKQEIGPTTMSGTSRTLRSSNRRAFLRTLLRGTPMARSDVADATGLSTSTVSSIANEPLEDGTLVETGAAARTGARTLLVEQCGYLVGALTAMGVSPMMTFHAGGTQVVRGTPAEVVERLGRDGDGATQPMTMNLKVYRGGLPGPGRVPAAAPRPDLPGRRRPRGEVRALGHLRRLPDPGGGQVPARPVLRARGRPGLRGRRARGVHHQYVPHRGPRPHRPPRPLPGGGHRPAPGR